MEALQKNNQDVRPKEGTAIFREGAGLLSCQGKEKRLSVLGLVAVHTHTHTATICFYHH